MKIYELKVDEYFDLDKILYGQCFRWNKNEEGKFVGVVEDNVIKIWQEGNIIYFYALNNDNIEHYIRHYFDVDIDYKKIIEGIQNKVNNKLLQEIIDYSKGTRILNQPIFEIVISYIFSASNNIKRIQGSIEKLCEIYGDEIVFEGKKYYTFPTIKQLKNVTIEDYREKIKIGYRDKYVFETVKDIIEKRCELEIVQEMESILAQKELIKLSGVGPKVADCILLFSMNKRDVFPVDTWIDKVMKKYSKNDNITKSQIQELVKKDFGNYSGIINHYMFYWGRENKID